jgi:hypothetical protein
MENLVARAKYIKSSSTPSLGHLGQSQPTWSLSYLRDDQINKLWRRKPWHPRCSIQVLLEPIPHPSAAFEYSSRTYLVHVTRGPWWR